MCTAQQIIPRWTPMLLPPGAKLEQEYNSPSLRRPLPITAPHPTSMATPTPPWWESQASFFFDHITSFACISCQWDHIRSTLLCLALYSMLCSCDLFKLCVVQGCSSPLMYDTPWWQPSRKYPLACRGGFGMSLIFDNAARNIFVYFVWVHLPVGPGIAGS